MTTYLCPMCGAQIPPGNTFCTGCGTALTLTKKTPTVWRVFRCILSIPVLLVLILSLVAGVCVYAMQHAVSESTFHTVVESVDILEMEITTEEMETVTVEDALYDAYESAFVDAEVEVPLTREEMSEVLDRSTLDEFLAGKMSDFMDDLLNDSGTGQITTDEIIGLLKENEELITEVSGGYVMSDEEYDAIAEAVDDMGITETLDVSTMKEESADVLAPLRSFFSPALLWITVGLCVVLCGLLMLLNLRSRFLAMLYTGLGFLLAGALCSLTLAAQSLLTGVLRSAGDLPVDMMIPVLKQLLAGFWVPGLCLAGAGLLLLVGFTVLRLVRRRA